MAKKYFVTVCPKCEMPYMWMNDRKKKGPQRTSTCPNGHQHKNEKLRKYHQGYDKSEAKKKLHELHEENSPDWHRSSINKSMDYNEELENESARESLNRILEENNISDERKLVKKAANDTSHAKSKLKKEVRKLMDRGKLKLKQGYLTITED